MNFALVARVRRSDAAINLLELTRAELHEFIASWDFSVVHAARLWSYLYYECVDTFGAMPELPLKMRKRLESECTIGVSRVERELASTDGFTRKFLLSLEAGGSIETVLMRFTGRVTACVSSQVGCAMGCVFCATGQMGFKRNLTAGEIVLQTLHVQRLLRASGDRLRNVVLMGMGEPLHNYEAVMKACDILRDPNGLALGAKKITLSTVGIVPAIIRMADEARPVHLAVSLHAASQAEREALVPLAKKWPLEELMEACRYFVQKLDRRIFFEWALIEGKNDTPEQAHAVGRLLKGLQAQINLIPLNPTDGYDGRPGHLETAKRFQTILAEYDLPSTVRQRRGLDIAAGCGQLAGGVIEC
ncbi:MAG: 23S rRNA (adenine(2503)-C(2))-methyltransferase RlmN [Nibricoccus sp.]